LIVALIIALIGIALVILDILLDQVRESSLVSLTTNVGHWTDRKYLRWLVFSIVIHPRGTVTFGLVCHHLRHHLVNLWRLFQVQVLARISANHCVPLI